MATWAVFCVNKKSCRPNCAVNLCPYVVLVLSCPNCHVAYCYSANDNNRRVHLAFPICKCNVVNSYVMSFLALNSDPLRYPEDATRFVQASEAPYVLPLCFSAAEKKTKQPSTFCPEEAVVCWYRDTYVPAIPPHWRYRYIPTINIFFLNSSVR